MQQIYKFVLSQANSGKLDSQAAVELLKMLKRHESNTAQQDIAIIGIASRLPGAEHPEAFWERLKAGADGIRPLPLGRKLDTEAYLAHIFSSEGEEQEAAHAYHEQAYLDEIDKFDCGFFKISPKEASLMDPNQRLFLETSWQAIEDAGYGGTKLIGSRTGVYAGYHNEGNHYGDFIAKADASLANVSLIGNMAPVIASRISY